MPGTDLFFQYAEEADKGVREREAQDRLKAEIINDDRARRMKAGGPVEEPPPPAPTEDPAGLRGYPLRQSTVSVEGIADPLGGMGVVYEEQEADPSLPRDPIGTTFTKGFKQTGGQVLRGVGGLVRGAAENAGVDAGLGAVYGAVDKLGLENPGLTAYMDTVKKLQRAIGLDTPLDSIASMGTDIGKKGEEIVRANLSAAGTGYFQQRLQDSISSVGLSVTALGLAFLTKNPMLGLSLMGAISGGQQYMDSREFGDSASWSLVTGGLNATAEILGEKLGFEKLLSVGEAVAKKEIKKAIFDGLKAWGLDVGGELLTTVSQDLISKMSDRPNLTTKELQNDLVDTFWSTLFMGPMQTAIVGGMGGAARLTTKSDYGPTSFKGWVAQEFPKMPFAETEYGGNVTLPDGRTLEIHTPFSPAATKLMEEGLEGGDQQVADEVRSGEKVVAGIYFKVGDTTITNNDLIFLTGQAVDETTLGHEKGHLVMSAVNMLATPEELKAVGLDAEATDQEKVIGGKYEDYIAKRQASPENPKSPLDKLFARVADFAHEAYSAAQGFPTERAVFERIRSGKMLERAVATPEQAAKMMERGAQYQVKAGNVTTPAGSFPLDHEGWKFEGEMQGFYQYTLSDPARPDFTPTLLVDKPENLQKKIDLTLAKWDAPKFQTRTPGPKGLTVNFTAPEVTALGEELLRGAFEKLQFTQSNEASVKKAIDLVNSKKVTLDTFLNHDPYTAWPDTAHQVAAEMIAGGVFQYVKDQIAEYKAGRITADEANKSRMIGMASVAGWYLPQSEVARMLQARQIAISPEGIPIRDLMEEQMKFETELQELKNRGLIDDGQILEAMDQFYSVDQAQNFARRVAAKKVRDISILNQLFYFSLLSNPVTQSANLIGNLGPVFFAIAEQYLSEKIPYSATPKGGAEGMAAGLYHGLLDAFVLAKRAAVTGESSFGGSKFRAESPTGVPMVDQARAATDQIMKDKTHPFHDPSSPQYPAAKRDVARLHRLGSNAISGERFSRLSSGAIDANGSMGRVIDLLGSITDSPFKGLAAGDEFFKVIAYRMSIYKSAYQLAATQGLEGNDFNTFVATFVDNPTSSADAEATAFAAKQTFTNEMGEIGQFLQKMSNKEAIGPIVKFFIPFVKITTNIGLYSVERVPGLNLVLKQVRDDMAAGGTKRDAALAKTATGGALMLTFAGLAMAGIVTGGGPADPKLKQLWSQPDADGNIAWQEYSFDLRRFGLGFVSYKRIEPFATMIGISADMVEVSRAFNVDVGEMFLVGALAGIRNMTSKTWMIGVSQLIETLTSGGPEELGKNTKKLARQLPSLLIPGGIAQLSRVVDPVKRDVQSWMDVIKSRIPGLSADLEPKYTLKGDPVTVQMYNSMPGKGFGMINPILYTGDTKDPVSLELVRNRIPIAMPSRRIGGGLSPDAANLEGKDTGVTLTPEQYGWFVKMAGNGLKDPKTGRGAWDELTAIITGDIPADYNYEKGKKPEALYYNQKGPDGKPVFSDGPEGGKAYIITRTLLDARNEVRKMIESGEAFPEVGAQYEEKKARKEINRAPNVGGAR